MIVNEIELIRRYRDAFPEDVDRMAWMLTLASSRGMTQEFGFLLADALGEERRVDWGPLFGVLRMARMEDEAHHLKFSEAPGDPGCRRN